MAESHRNTPAAIPHHNSGALLLLAAFALVVLLVAPFIGSQGLSLNAVIGAGAHTVDGEIFWRLRLPRVLAAFLAGAGLSLCGLVFQALFRNTLAEPFTLGVASGAAAGASLYLIWGVPFVVAGLSGLSLSAFGGSLLTVVLLYVLAARRGGFEPATLLLAGVAISLTFSSGILFIQATSDLVTSIRILHWTMGGFDMVDYGPVLHMLPFVLGGSMLVLVFARDLNQLTLGDDWAVGRGVDMARTRRILFVATFLVVGGIVAECGPIGFVGLIAPHICRRLLRADHRLLIPAASLFGGAFLVVTDTRPNRGTAANGCAVSEVGVGVINAR